MRNKHLTAILAAALVLAPTAALAHGGHSGGRNSESSSAKRSSWHRPDSRSQGDAHKSAQGSNHQTKRIRPAGEDDRDKHGVKDQTATPAATPSATPTPHPTPQVIGSFQLRGTIGTVGDGTIVVNGVTISIADKTKVEHGPLATGQSVKIIGFVKADGTLVARIVKVKDGDVQASPEPTATAVPTIEPSASPTPEVTATPTPSPTATPAAPQFVGTFHIRGTVSAITDDSIVINGQTYTITDDTKLPKRLKVGSKVTVKGGITPDGTLVVQKVSTNHRKHRWYFWNWFGWYFSK